jgi:hypothetical protein
MRTIMTDEELVAWGWRIPFLSGIVIGVVALLIQFYGTEFNPNDGFYNSESTVDDEPVLQSESNRIEIQRTKRPITESFRRENRAPLIASALVPMLAGANYYVSFVW